MKLMTFANQKGGVGKTTLAVHMAIHAHNMGFRVLLVDLDQQGSATYLLTGDGDRHQTEENTALDLWYPGREIPVQTSLFGFDFLQASAGLDAVDGSGSNADMNEAIRALRRLEELDYHLVVVDCPPAPGIRQIAPLMVADTAVAPVTPDLLGTQGLLSLVQTYKNIIRPANPKLELKVLINRLKANSLRNRTIAEDLTEKFGQLVIPYHLYDREDVRTGLLNGKPHWEFCKDAAQKNAWYQAFDTLLRGIPNDEDDSGTEIPEPPDADKILEQQGTEGQP